MSLFTRAQYVPPTHVDGAAPNGILWDSVLTGRTLPVRTTTPGFSGAPGAVMFYDKATGKIGIDPKGLSLNAVIVTYTTGYQNITGSSPGPFIYGGNTTTNAYSPSTGTPRTFPAIQQLIGLPPTTFAARFGTTIGPPLSPSLATTGDASNIASTDGLLNLPWSFGKVVNLDSLIANNQVLADSNFKVVGQNNNANANLLGYGPPIMNASPVKGCFQYSISGVAGNQVGAIVFYTSVPSCTAPTLSSSITHQTCSNLNDGAIDLTATGGSPSPTFAWSGPNSFTSTAEDISSLAPGTYTVIASSGTCTATASYTVNAGNPAQAASVSIASNAAGNTICAGTSVTFTATPTNGGTSPSYQWKLNGTNVGTNSNTYTTTSLVNSDAVTVVMTSNAVCTTGSPATSNIINTVVNQPSYSSVTESSVGSYTWNGQTYSASGVYTWTGVNAQGCDSVVVLNLTLAPISNITNVCPYLGTNQTLIYTANVAGASSYTWTLPANTQLISGQGTRSIQIKILNGFATQSNKQIRVIPAGGSMQIIYLLAQLPVTPSTIVASSANICTIIGTSVPVNFTIPKVVEAVSNATTATSYIWTAQNGTTTITHPNGNGVNDTTVAISFASNFTTSNITVQSVNACGVSSIRSYLVTTNAPTQLSLISGAINTCEFIGASGQLATYSVRADANIINYAWTLPQGATNVSGQGSRTISFRYPAGFTGGTISVTATNGCGTSPSRSLTVSRLLPVTPGNIDVINTQSCPNRVYTYSIASFPFNATSLLWTIPDGATLVSGQGSRSITVSYPLGVVDGYVTVKSVANCAFSSARNAQVRMAPCPVDPSPGFTKGIMTTTPSTMDVKVFPNPTTSAFNLQVRNTGSKDVKVNIMDLQGRVIKSFITSTFQINNIGHELIAGVYMVEVLNGEEKKVVRVVKY